MNQEFQTKWVVYILICKDGKMYTGYTTDLERRLEEHAEGTVQFTKTRLPVRLITYIVFSDKLSATSFEAYLKSGSGRAFAHKRFI